MFRKLCGGYRIRWKELVFDPTNPEAEWWVYGDFDSFTCRGACLVRQVPEGWEVLYSRWSRFGDLATTPPDPRDLATAQPEITDLGTRVIPYLQHLLANQPDSVRNTTGKPYFAEQGDKCCKCSKPALVKLSAYSTSGTTSHVVRYFCRKCLRKGSKVGVTNLICHVCREPGADKKIHWVAHPEGKGPYEFRVHLKCAADIDKHCCRAPTLEERKPLLRAVVKTATDYHGVSDLAIVATEPR